MKDCFVIGPIGEEGSWRRIRADQVFEYVIIPAMSECGMDAERADHLSTPGMITAQVIHHVLEAPLVIADLTDRNPNVFYELALRHVVAKPLIQMIDSRQNIPFDVASMRTIKFDYRNLSSVEQAKVDVIRHVQALTSEGVQSQETPVSMTLGLMDLQHSDKPEKWSLAEMIGGLTQVNSRLDSLELMLSNPENLLPSDYLQEVIRWSLQQRSMPEDTLHELESILDQILSSEDIHGFFASRPSTANLRDKLKYLHSLIRKFTQDGDPEAQ